MREAPQVPGRDDHADRSLSSSVAQRKVRVDFGGFLSWGGRCLGLSRERTPQNRTGTGVGRFDDRSVAGRPPEDAPVCARVQVLEIKEFRWVREDATRNLRDHGLNT